MDEGLREEERKYQSGGSLESYLNARRRAGTPPSELLAEKLTEFNAFAKKIILAEANFRGFPTSTFWERSGEETHPGNTVVLAAFYVGHLGTFIEPQRFLMLTPSGLQNYSSLCCGLPDTQVYVSLDDKLHEFYEHVFEAMQTKKHIRSLTTGECKFEVIEE